MIWAGIVGNKLIGSFKVDDGVKLTSETYCKFLNNTFFKWYRNQSRSSKAKYVFMHDNAPSHAANATTQFLTKKGISNSKLMQWPPASPDLNPIENLWNDRRTIVKKKIYDGGRQYNSKSNVWDAIQQSCKGVSTNQIEALTNSMDKRLISVIQQKGDYINM